MCFKKITYLEKWGGRGKKELIKIPSIGHLKYDRFKQNIKQDNVIEQNLEVLSCNSDDSRNYSITINLCCHIIENYEEEFISAAGDSALIFSGQISVVETASIMNGAGLKISQLCIFLRIFRNKSGVKIEPEKWW